MVSMLALSVVDLGFDPRSGQTIDDKIDICCFSATKDWLHRNRDNVSDGEWSDMSIGDSVG